MKTIALHGWYWDGNFGDVLMAVMHARVLRDAGYRVVVHRLPPHHAAAFQLETTSSVDELLRQADALVYGGGGLLTRNHRDRTEVGPFAEDSNALLAGLERRRIPLLLCSVGGDGEDLGTWRPWQEGFLRRASGISVRNDADRTWVERYNPAVVWHHDIVWQSAKFFPGDLPGWSCNGPHRLPCAVPWLRSRRSGSVSAA